MKVGRWRYYGTRREVLHGQRVVLEGCREIGNGRVSGILRVCKETKVSQSKLLHHADALLEKKSIALPLVVGLNEDNKQGADAYCNPQKKKV